MQLRYRAAYVTLLALAAFACSQALGERELKAARHLCAVVSPGPDASPEVQAFCASVQPKPRGDAGAGGAAE